MAIDRIILDLDGVLADFVGAAQIVHDRPEEEFGQIDRWNFFEGWGITANEFWSKIDSEGEDFWAHQVNPYPWYHEVFATCLEVAPVTISTSPSDHPACFAGKKRWIREWIGEDFRSLMIGPEKHLLAAPGRVLIDDSPFNCEAFEEAGGASIVFPAKWNESARQSHRVVDFLKDELEKAEERFALHEV